MTRQPRVIGGTCANGHRLTVDNVYTNQGRIRCARCHLDRSAINQRVRRGSKPKARTDPDAMWTCRHCETTMVRRAFGVRGHNKDGTILWQSVCGPCRARSGNERRKARTAERLAAEHEERRNLTDWIIAQAWRLKRERGVLIHRTRVALGVPRKTWHEWTRGASLPDLARLRGLVEAMQVWSATHEGVRSIGERRRMDRAA